MRGYHDSHTVADPRDPDHETVLRAVFEVTSWGLPAQTYGPPELCYPGEPAEIVLTGAFDTSGTDVLAQLSDLQQGAVEQEILEEYDFRKPELDDY